MNPLRKYTLGQLVGKSKDEINVKQILLGTNGMIGLLENGNDVFTVLSPLTRGRSEFTYKHERLMNLAVYFPYVVTVHESREKQYCILRVVHVEQRHSKSIILEEHNRSIHTLICGKVGVVMLTATNQVLFVSFSRVVEKLCTFPEEISVPAPVKSLCCVHDGYCLLANQFQGTLFDVSNGKIILKLSLPSQSTASFTLTKVFDSLVVAATALTIYFWPIDTDQLTPSISPKSIATETPATCVAFEKNLFVGFAGGMIAMYSMDGTLLQTLSDPQINPIKSSVTEQLQLRIKDLLNDSDSLYAVSSSGEVKRFDLKGGATDVVIRKSQSVVISNIAILKNVKELCVITKSTTQKSDIIVHYFNSFIHTDTPKVAKLKNMGKEIKRKFQSQYALVDNNNTTAYPQHPLPANEKKRLEMLYTLQILDTKPQKKFDKITALCCRIFSVPISLITFVDHHRAWFKSKCGLDDSEVNRRISFCTYALLDDAPDVFVVPNTVEDPLFKSNPLVLGPPDIRFYAGVPLSFKGHKLGTLCIIDRVPRVFSQEERATLISFSEIVVQHIKSKNKQKSQITDDLVSYSLQTPLNNAKQCLNLLSEKHYRIQDDPLFEQLQLSITMSKIAINDSFYNSKALYLSSKNPIPENISKISVVNLFEDLKCSFLPHPRDTSLPAFLYCNQNYFKQDFEQKQMGKLDLCSTNDSMEDKREIAWILDPFCPIYLYSYPVTVLRTLMDLIGGASLISENELEVQFKPTRETEEDPSKKKIDPRPETHSKLWVEMTILGITIDEYTKKLLFRKPFDEKCPFSDLKGKLLLYCYIVQKWVDKLEGSCFIEELTNGISVSVEIPSVPSEFIASPQGSHSNSPIQSPRKRKSKHTLRRKTDNNQLSQRTKSAEKEKTEKEKTEEKNETTKLQLEEEIDILMVPPITLSSAKSSKSNSRSGSPMQRDGVIRAKTTLTKRNLANLTKSTSLKDERHRVMSEDTAMGGSSGSESEERERERSPLARSNPSRSPREVKRKSSKPTTPTKDSGGSTSGAGSNETPERNQVPRLRSSSHKAKRGSAKSKPPTPHKDKKALLPLPTSTKKEEESGSRGRAVSAGPKVQRKPED